MLFRALILAAGLSSTPALARHMTGNLSVRVVDYLNGSSRTEYWVESDDGKSVRLHGYPTTSLPLMSNIPIRAKIRYIDDDEAMLLSYKLLCDVGKEREIRLGGPAEPTRRSVAALLVSFSSRKAPSTPDEYKQTMAELDKWYTTATQGQLGFELEGVFGGKYAVPWLGKTCRYELASKAAKAQALAQGFKLTGYQHEIYVMPPKMNCGFSGIGEMACGNKTCRVWTSFENSVPLIAHELGHNLDLHHANVDANDDGSFESEYGDWSDPMGNNIAYAASFNPPHLEQAGWFTALKPGWLIEHTEGDMTHTLKPLASTDTDTPQAVKMPRKKGGSYYLAYRAPVGIDAPLEGKYAGKLGVWYVIPGSRGYDTPMTRLVEYLVVGETATVGDFSVTFTEVKDGAAVLQLRPHPL